MGLFNREQKEKTYEENGFIIGVDSHIVYHAPKGVNNYILPSSAVGVKQEAINDMSSSVIQITVPGTVKIFSGNLQNCKNLKKIILSEGVEEVKCEVKNGMVDFQLPSTIKIIGKDNYPIVQNLVIPNGVTKIPTMFASHDTNLISVEVPGTIKNIPAYAFNQCKNLHSITLHEGVETSEINSFRNTNNLHVLKIPSTFNGRFDLSMEARAGSSSRGNSSYDGKKFERERESILSIFIKRGEKYFEFRIKRGDSPIIKILQNNIVVYQSNGPAVTIDCNVLMPGIYNIENGILSFLKQGLNVPSTQESPQEYDEKLDILFQTAYKENILPRDDFKGLSFKTKMQIKVFIKKLFLDDIARTGKVNADFDRFDYWFKKAIKEVDFDEVIEYHPIQEDFGTTGKKR